MILTIFKTAQINKRTKVDLYDFDCCTSGYIISDLHLSLWSGVV